VTLKSRSPSSSNPKLLPRDSVNREAGSLNQPSKLNDPVAPLIV
jgi:hypothetical protein